MSRQNIILVIVVFTLLIFNVFQFFEKRKLQTRSVNQYEKLKEQYEQEILRNLIIIDSLELNIVGYYRQIEDFKEEIDSLKIVKQRVIYVYDNKKKEINSFDASKLEKYWKNEF